MDEHSSDQTLAAGLPVLLTVGVVMGRYGLRDRRAARRVMDAAGAFQVGGRLLVRAEDLLAWEECRIAARAPTAGPTEPQPRGRSARTRPAARAPLPPGWWREGP